MTKMLTILAGAFLAPALLLAQAPHNGWFASPGPANRSRTEGQLGPVVGKPFSGTEVRKSIQTLTDGSHLEQFESSQYYRDNEGRARSESKNIALIFDPVGGFNYQLDLKWKTYTKTPIDAKSAAYAIAAIGDETWISRTSHSVAGSAGHGTMVHTNTVNGRPAGESKTVTEDLQSQSINGLHVRASRVTTTIPVGSIGNDRELKVVNERWYSEDLGVLVKSTNSDPRFGLSTYDLTNVVQAAPNNPTLFVVPADFTLRTAPHEMHQQQSAGHHE